MCNPESRLFCLKTNMCKLREITHEPIRCDFFKVGDVVKIISGVHTNSTGTVYSITSSLLSIKLDVIGLYVGKHAGRLDLLDNEITYWMDP